MACAILKYCTFSAKVIGKSIFSSLFLATAMAMLFEQCNKLENIATVQYGTHR